MGRDTFRELSSVLDIWELYYAFFDMHLGLINQPQTFIDY